VLRFMFLALLLSLTACKTTGSVNEPVGKYFNGNATSEQVVSLASELRTQLVDPENTIMMVYNHGTDWGGKFQDCLPDTMPTFIKTWGYAGIDGRNVVIFYLCSQEAEDRNAMGKARSIENEAILDRLLAAGVPAQNIFVIGHSGGASTALLTAERASEKFNSVIVSAPGYGFAWLEAEGEGSNFLDIEYSKWKTELAGVDDMSGYVLLYEGDTWAPPSDASFLSRHPQVVVETVRDADGDGFLCPGEDEPHFYWWTGCFRANYLADVEAFVIDRLNNRRHVI